MDARKRKIARNAARVEFIANAEEIMSMLDKGFNKFNVYNELLSNGRITMSYRSFCGNLQQFKNPEQKKRTAKPIVSTPLQASGKKEPFGQLEDVDVSKLV